MEEGLLKIYFVGTNMRTFLILMLLVSQAHAYRVKDLVGKWKGEIYETELIVEIKKDGTYIQYLPEVELKAQANCKIKKIDRDNFKLDCQREGTEVEIDITFVDGDHILFGNSEESESRARLERI